MKTHIILHTVAKRGKTSKEEITRWHVQDNGWRDFGYHYYILKDGTIQYGREESTQGAHCLEEGMNRKGIGICLEGHGNYEEWTDQQLKSLIKLCWDVQDRNNIPTENILGHREVKGV